MRADSGFRDYDDPGITISGPERCIAKIGLDLNSLLTEVPKRRRVWLGRIISFALGALLTASAMIARML